jgi:integrase
MPTLKLTQAAVDRLKPPASGRVEYWDSQLPGFGLRVSAPRPGNKDGRKIWQAFYRFEGRMVREKLGTLDEIPSVAEARERARESMTKARAGANPVEERHVKEAEERRQVEIEEARKSNTVATVIDRYLAERPVDKSRKPMRPEYLAETARTLDKNVKQSALGERPLDDITSEDIKRLVRDIAKGAPSQANHTLAYLKAMLSWAVDEGLIEKNPAAFVKMPAQKVERERALSDEEIRSFWLACNAVDWPFGPLAQLLLLTAQRRDELAHATWGEFDLEKQAWTLPGSRTKNGRSHIVHLSGLAVEILERLPRIASKTGWAFTTGLGGDNPVSGFGRGRERIAAAMADVSGTEAAPFTLHDLRRSAATGMAALAIAPHVVDKILNHSSGKIAGVAKIYNRFEYLAERKAALEAWARHVESLIRPTSSNVVEIPRRVEAEFPPARLG